MSAYRTSTNPVVAEIVEWLRERAKATVGMRGIGPPVDQNTVVSRSGELIADEIERRWGHR